jgi:hypothetical protein
MRIMLRSFVTALALALLLAPAASAQDFGVMESAEIIQPGNFKFTAYPVFVLGENGGDDNWGVALRGGYGFSDRVDGELAVAAYDGRTLFGGNLELALLRTPPAIGAVNFSVRGGAHLAQADAADAVGLDLAAILSARVARELELVGSLDFTRSLFDEPLEDVNTLHLVPGIEYGISQRLDFLAEVGIGLDDAAANYLSAGLAVYFR